MANNKPGCLGIILQALGIMPKGKADEPLPYGLRADFLSPSELSFYKVLLQSVEGRAAVMTKVSLGDIFFVKKPDKNFAYNNKIARKHVDFLLCTTDTLKPMAGIELDDTSHQKQNRIDRDEFVDEVFKTSNLPLVKFVNRRSYTLQEVREKISFLFDQPEKPAATVQQPAIENNNGEDPDKPLCPSCGVPMVRRAVNKGPNMGKKFYGCPNFPKCRQIIEI